MLRASEHVNTTAATGRLSHGGLQAAFASTQSYCIMLAQGSREAGGMLQGAEAKGRGSCPTAILAMF